jgi:YggT family protein
VLNTSSQGIRTVVRALDRITAPLYRPIRKIMPDFGGLDFSPIVLIILIQIAHMLLNGAETSLTYGP